MDKGSVYDIYIKYPNSIGGTLFKNMKLIGEFLGPDVIRSTIDPDIDTTWFNIQNESDINDFIRSVNIKDLTFYVFSDAENNKKAIAKEWISEFRVTGNDFKFEVKNVTIEQKMVIIKTLKQLGINITEI